VAKKAKKANKTTKITKPIKIEEEAQSRTSLFDYLRFGESYTSLILGIIVVIISTVLLLSFVNNRNSEKDIPQLLSQKDINLPTGPITTDVPQSGRVESTNTPASTNIAKATQGSVNPATGEYTVAAGDNLWNIAEKQYKSGYNWVDIARANKLSNPGQITAGQKLKMPKVEQKVATVVTPQKQQSQTVVESSTKITGDTYTTVKGDTLWSISVRAYGDGYQWSKIASANNLVNPSLIHSGNKLKIPREK
jgi:LysM repeat protein